MAGAEYWIWLQKSLGPASSLACKLIAHFGDPEKLYCAGRSAWLASGLLTERQCEKLCQSSPSESYDVMMACLKYQLDIVTPDNPLYPRQLLLIRNYPMVLYVKGNASALTAPVLTSIVGTRKASQGGIRFTRILGEQLAKASVAVVSGGALGIDTAAHEGALAAGGVTIVVLGCGIGHEYLMQNEAMRRQASGVGAVISEYFPDSAPTKGSFPERNRIIAGLSQATVVVEAAEKSGSFITAGDARNMNRCVFAVPATASGSFYGGTDLLIRQKKAYPASSAQDIIQMLRLQNPDWTREYEKILIPEPYGKPVSAYDESVFEKRESSAAKKQPTAVQEKPIKAKPKKETAQSVPANDIFMQNNRAVPDGLEGDMLTVWKALAQGPKSPDDLIHETQLPANKVMIAISKLEFKGLSVRDFGKVSLK